MDLHGNPQIVCGRFKQILTQFMLKSLHIILGLRVPSIRRYDHQGEVKKSDKWFNLVFGGRPASLENLDFWQRNLMEPMLIDIILAQETPNSSSDHNFHASSGLGTTDTILERWVVQYEHLGMMAPQTSDASDQKVHKKIIILLRSLYSMLRLLPAYKAFQKPSSLSKTICFGIKYKVSVFGTPFSSAEEDLMKQYSFVPVDAQQGRVAISVTYRKSLSDFNLETPAVVLPKIITEYVGSHPTDALRVLSSSLEKGFHGTSLASRGMLSPSTPFQHPHGWTNGLHSGVSLPSPPTHLCGDWCQEMPKRIQGGSQVCFLPAVRHVLASQEGLGDYLSKMTQMKVTSLVHLLLMMLTPLNHDLVKISVEEKVQKLLLKHCQWQDNLRILLLVPLFAC